MLTLVERETVTYTCPECRRRITVLADEYGDHGCACGWEPNTLADDVWEYVRDCVHDGDKPDSLTFSLIYLQHGGVPGRRIDELIAKELAKYEQRN